MARLLYLGGMLGFWFLEVTSLLYIVGAINFFVSGQMLPPDFLTDGSAQCRCRVGHYRIFSSDLHRATVPGAAGCIIALNAGLINTAL